MPFPKIRRTPAGAVRRAVARGQAANLPKAAAVQKRQEAASVAGKLRAGSYLTTKANGKIVTMPNAMMIANEDRPIQAKRAPRPAPASPAKPDRYGSTGRRGRQSRQSK